MEEKPFFSVIMPTYNRAFCICNAIDSLLAQTYQNFDFIIVDDCSTDGTEELVKKTYENEFRSGRFSYTRHEKNMKLNAARNTGLSMAKNEWIVFLDDDNLLYNEYLETYACAIHDNPDCKIFYAQIEHHNGMVMGMKMDYAYILNNNFIDMGVYVCNRSVYDTYGNFDTNLRRRTDYDFILRTARLEKTFFILKPLLHYNTGDYPRIYNSENFEEASKIIHEKMSRIYHPFYENVRQISSINVYYDMGNGFSEYEKDVFYHFPIELNVTENMRSIMIKPCSNFCIVKDIGINYTDIQ